MKNKNILFLFALTLLLQIYVNAQTTFHRSYGGNSSDVGYSVTELSDGKFVLLGSTLSYGQGNSDLFIMRTNQLGDIEFFKTYGNSGSEDIGEIINDNDTLIIAGMTMGGNPNSSLALLFKIDTIGNIIWAKTYGAGSSFNKVIKNSSNNYVCVGAIDSFGNGSVDGYVLEVDSDGQIIWSFAIGTSLNESFNSISELPNSDYVIGGNITVSGNNSDFYLIKISSSGDVIWSRKMGGTQSDALNDVIYYNNSIYCIGYNRSFSIPGGMDLTLFKVGLDGTLIWTKGFTGLGSGGGDLTVMGNHLIGVGHSDNFDSDGGGGDPDPYIFALDENDNFLWQKSIEAFETDQPYDVRVTSDNSILITGLTQSFGPFLGQSNNISFIKLDSFGNLNCLIHDVSSPFNSPNFDIDSGAVAIEGGSSQSITLIVGEYSPDTTIQCLYNPCILSQPTISPDGNILESSSLTGNQWYRNDTLINGATNQEYSVSLPVADTTCYTVMVSDNFGCTYISNPYCYYPLPIGISETTFTINIFPNPIVDVLTVNGYSPAYLKLSNTFGQTVAEVSKSNKLYVGNLSQGLYVLQVFDANGQPVKTEKVIVAK